MELAVGTVIDRYVVDQVLGEGGMAVVYLAKHTQLGTLHALKVLTITSRSIRQRLVQEGQVQASLRHPNIVAVTDIVMINGAPGLVMEYIDGPSVDELLEERALSYEQVDVLVAGILAGVAHAHDQGLVHRDLKPANIMLAIRGSALVPKVTDFGLAKLLDADNKRSATRTGSTMGTPHYMSPEQVSDSKNVDLRTDVFALGAVLYEMIAGQRAFAGDNLLELFSAVAAGDFIPIRQLKPDIPERMEAAIHGALEPDRGKRIQSVHDLLAIWKGEKLRKLGATAPIVEAGPFDAAFLKSVKSISSMSSSAPDATWSPSIEGHAITVESVYSHPAEPEQVPAISASSFVSGKSLVVGGGALMVTTIGAVVVLFFVGLLGLWWANRAGAPRQITQVEDRPMPVPTLAAPEPIPESTQPKPKPVRRSQPKPTKPAPTTAPSPASAPTDPPQPTELDPVEATDPPPPEPTIKLEGLDDPDPKLRAAAVSDLRGVPNSTSTLLRIVKQDSSPRVRKAAHLALVHQASRRRGDLAALEAYFTAAVASNAFNTTGKNMIAYGHVGSDLSIPEAFVRRYKGGVLNQKRGMEALERIGTRTNRVSEALAALDRIDPLVEGRLGRGNLLKVRERLGGR